MNNVTCVMFDLDDTLWECKPVISRADDLFYQWCQETHPEIAEKYSQDALFHHKVNCCSRQTQWRYHLTKIRKNWLNELALEFAIAPDFVEEGFLVYWLARNEVTLLEGVEQFLLDLKERYVVGSITNGNADVEHIGLNHLFDFSVTAIEAGVAKPNRGIFELASKKAGVPLNDILHVGDDWERDVQGALSSGAKAVWVSGLSSGRAGSGEDMEPHYQVDSVTQLRELLL